MWPYSARHNIYYGVVCGDGSRPSGLGCYHGGFLLRISIFPLDLLGRDWLIAFGNRLQGTLLGEFLDPVENIMKLYLAMRKLVKCSLTSVRKKVATCPQAW